jgi:two-component system, LytTR family, sensor kinase
MHLEMKDQCEKCRRTLAPSAEGYICSYECTFCPACARGLQYVCANCSGELVPRPRRQNTMTDPSSSGPGSSKHTGLVWGVSLAAWTFISLAATLTIYLYDRTVGMERQFISVLGLECSQCLTYAPLTPFVFWLALRYPVLRSHWLRRSLLLFAGGLIFALAHVVLRGAAYPVWDGHIRDYVSPLWDAHAHAVRVRWDLFKTLFLLNWLDDLTGTYLPIVLIAHVVSYYRSFRDRQLRASHLETQLTKAHLQALKSQLQPHFLFNTLHSISALMLTDVRAADRMMTRLSELLRMSLDNTGVQMTTLGRELEFVTAYLDIERIRFEDRLKVTLDIAPETITAQVPHLLLQPLAENAVHHGISRLSAGGEVRISSAHEGALVLRVKDNGPGPTTGEDGVSSPGLGLNATRERLRTLYGDSHQMEIRHLPNEGTEVCVRIPFRATPRPMMQNTRELEQALKPILDEHESERNPRLQSG